MGKCRDGPNVRVLNQCNGNALEKEVGGSITNPLCIGVGLEDVGAIVANFFGEKKDMGMWRQLDRIVEGRRPNSTMASQSAQSIHDFTVKDARGNDVDFSTYKGKVLLIVNVASKCGLTNSNYTELAQLYGKYKNQGFEILAFPCNQFGEEEPGTNEEILETACTRFKAEYPIFDKIDVNGDNAARFLVDKDGHVVDRYAPTTSPFSIEKDIKKLLGVN
ncbi:hypothetical protein MRB53_032491 [Persea americana]|uniref:Uncharacterized protein n=1 Tax=Persea americana TaxID=3435 RepID=A0ACC2KSY0_PERAE|nr:hypothetical protein MRB53_032491 [Persea americana]